MARKYVSPDKPGKLTGRERKALQTRLSQIDELSTAYLAEGQAAALAITARERSKISARLARKS